jgi:LPXTG-motif cell wall-anchored protein
MPGIARGALVAGLVGVWLAALGGTALAQTAARAALNPTGGTRVMGASTLTAQGGQTAVVVRITGAPANSTHVNHIHTGSCEAEGGIVYPLTDLRTNAQGEGMAVTQVNASLATILAGRHYVNVHAGAALPSPGISCGNIVAGSLPATGTPSDVPAPLLASAVTALAGTALLLRRRTIGGVGAPPPKK